MGAIDVAYRFCDDIWACKEKFVSILIFGILMNM